MSTLSSLAVSLVILGSVLLAGCASPQKTAHTPLIARFFLETREGEPGQRVILPQSQVAITISPKPIVMEFDIVDAEVAQVRLGRCLLFRLAPLAARDLYRITGASLGRRLVLALNDEVLGARRLDEPLADGAILIFLERPDDQLLEMVERLKSTSADVKRHLSRT